MTNTGIAISDKNTFYKWLDWITQVILIIGGIILGVISIRLFMTPFDILPTGFTGVAVILNELISTPIGMVILVLNIPVMVLGYKLLSGWDVVIRTIIVVVIYSFAFDISAPWFPEEGVSDNVLLNAVFAGILSGISVAFIMRAGATYGSTSMLATIIQRKTGIPMSTTYLYTDLLIVVSAGFVFSWESSLYAIIVLIITGLTTDYVLEGPSVIRTAMIITDKPREVSDVILYDLQRGVTALNGKGMYTEKDRSLLYITISRAEVSQLRNLVSSVDENAFIVIGQGHTAYGSGFRKHRPPTTTNGRKQQLPDSAVEIAEATIND